MNVAVRAPPLLFHIPLARSLATMNTIPPKKQMTWFEALFGFRETKYDTTKNNFSVTFQEDPETGLSEGLLCSNAKPDTKYSIGRFHYPTLGELREKTEDIVDDTASSTTELTFDVLVGDVQSFHGKPENKFATFQVASQFNCLEFVGASVVPESGVTVYEFDHTQGPACCLCTGPAITYRNYMHKYEDEVVVNSYEKKTCTAAAAAKSIASDDDTAGGTSVESEEDRYEMGGQRKDRQANMLSDFSRKIGNVSEKGGAEGVFWDLKGGYVLSNPEKLKKIPWEKFPDSDDSTTSYKYDELMQTLRIGVHEDIQVTHCGGFGRKPMDNTDMKVTHCLCSAVPVSYNRSPSTVWEPLARIILKACYESVFHSALLNMKRHNGAAGSRKLFLTQVGGGAFGNRSTWIHDAIIHSCKKFKNLNLEVYLVCYGRVDNETRELAKELQNILCK